VSSTGEVLATDPVAAPDGSYQVVVAAHQTTRNLQNPTPKVSIILLDVTVNKVGDGWQVSNIGPKTGSRPPVAQQIPAPEPLPGKPDPQR
jgi:Mce-associated membrane protein